MIVIPVKEGENIERALKRFKRKFEKTGVIKELRERQKFTKPSIKRREEVKKLLILRSYSARKIKGIGFLVLVKQINGLSGIVYQLFDF
jgi:small subunit ribosomal protein S21